jgi:hypothetical protein
MSKKIRKGEQMNENKGWLFAFTFLAMAFCLMFIVLITERRLIIKETSRELIKEMSSSTTFDNGKWCMVYRYQVNGVDSVAFLEDVNGNGDLSEELEEHRAYLRRFGEIVNDK